MKKYFHYYLSFLFIILVGSTLQAQNSIGPQEGYSPQVGTLLSMLDDLKGRIESIVENLDQTGVDYLHDKDSNRIGALIFHLAATEAYYQVYTFEKRQFNRKERKKWSLALNLGEKARNEFQGQSIRYYLDLYHLVRERTKEEFKKRDDNWLAETNESGSMNNHWAWYHVMEHQANHMGQMVFLKKRIPKN